MDNVAIFLNPSGLKSLLEKAGKFKKTKTLTASYGKLYGNYGMPQYGETKRLEYGCRIVT